MGHPFVPLEVKADNTPDILKYVELFYEDMYREDECWSQEDIAVVPAKEVWDKCATRVSPEHKAVLDAPITQEEVAGAPFGMHKGKASGPDGLPVEYLMTATRPLLLYLCEAFNRLFSGEEASPATFGQTTIVLLYKKGSVEEIRNWRPISLLSAPYKLYAKVLANRVAAVLPALVHSTQTGFIPRRQILVNVLLVRQIMERAQDFQPPLATLFLDFEKAYDRVRWPFLLQGMRCRGFGEVFVKVVEGVLGMAVAKVQVNGFLSSPLKITRSVREGCPLSAALYVLYVEHLHEMIRANDQIPGFELPRGAQVKTNAFADDTAAVTRATHQSVSALRNEVVLFEKYAGARIKWGKSVAVVPAGVDVAMFEGMKTQLPGDQFLYLGAVSDPPKKAWKDYKRSLRRFMWKDDPCVSHLIYRVRWEKLVQPRSVGGLGLLDPRVQVSALQMRTVLWLLLEDDMEPWKLVTLQEMAEAVRVHPTDVKTALLHPQLLHGLRRGVLWSNALEKWREAPLRQTAPQTCDQILEQSLFGNHFVLQSGVPFGPFPWQGCPGAFGKQWLSCGVFRVGDIWDEQEGTWKEEGEVLGRLDHQPKKQERLEEIKRAIPQEWVDCLVAKDRMQGEWVTLEGQGRPIIFFQLKERLGSQWYGAEAWEDVGRQKALGDVLVRRPDRDSRLHEENIRPVVVLRDQTVSKGRGFRPFKPAYRPLQIPWDPSIWEWAPRNSLMKRCRIHQVTTKVIYRSLLVPTDLVDEMREIWRKRGWLDQKALLCWDASTWRKACRLLALLPDQKHAGGLWLCLQLEDRCLHKDKSCRPVGSTRDEARIGERWKGRYIGIVLRGNLCSGACAGSLEGDAEEGDSPVDRRTLLCNEVLSRSPVAWECSPNWVVSPIQG
ncbi:hypothetical protein CBR_g50077 [Chara braunii]|uniref:Reverse transcriptase domain-containing protein n=1 Tax=Chara braunii TaxID=69332 RepID=A0A388M623_CHABU|nr:hypothetical protein CBR_g50077 [Chara braunii]|eukprot:GBG89986.1 hypothetical protein CBR_g50077 [Chara braunii]